MLPVGWLSPLVNLLAAGLALAAIAFYVVVYTLLLKRRTPQNIVWGGAAGCMPVLIGWAAVTGRAGLGAVGAVRRDLPVDAAALLAAVDAVPGRLRGGRGADAAGGGRRAGRRAADRAYSWAMVACSLLLVPVADRLVLPGRGDPAWVPGSWLGARAAADQLGGGAGAGTRPAKELGTASMRLFHLSISYLTVLFVAIALDPFVRF